MPQFHAPADGTNSAARRSWPKALIASLAVALVAPVLAAPPVGVYERREADWRNGAIVYQVLVDRFVPAANLAAKRHLYPAPKVLRDWT